ncbi:methyltransferase domain-containing protein [Luteipulveratus sp. YIM 133132]|uniref:Methyltransferase domain-containing protein n=1 Tax=Luteipulveratus flavus TaxID=3031728 RepID=A0ABT6CD75_9MICO|nr:MULTISPECIES: methyltransferase domain-containing protein [unclassified Luteipulveratus]MDE9367387.1 methyltransferase domain-containing protein [Luteipulveratus sp. YIM 133132]MDF8266232.1 methyltransferase domain-containing protein [Luteipulveratus sp. YIM 133296]
MQCDYFDAGRCRSCALMGVPYAEQLAQKQATVAALLAGDIPAQAWDEAFHGPESAFRNKAKLVVGGRRGEPTLGILDAAGAGVDLRYCGLHEPGLAESIPVLADLVARIGLTPYDVPRRTGELKNVLITHSPDGELMIRFVLRSPGQLPRLERAVPEIRAALPQARVVTANLLPEHKAVVEGEEERVLTEHDTLPMRVNDVTLHLRPRSFFQTNTAVAAGLYRQAAQWAESVAPASVVDLYCGVGGFGLHLAAPGRTVHGVEVSADAVESAWRSAAELAGNRRIGRVTFAAGDATAYGLDGRPDLLVVNPPRRGIGPLAPVLEGSGIQHLLYSSCNATSLARDLAAMPSYVVRRARLFDMFPQTAHHEVVTLLERQTS